MRVAPRPLPILVPHPPPRASVRRGLGCFRRQKLLHHRVRTAVRSVMKRGSSKLRRAEGIRQADLLSARVLAPPATPAPPLDTTPPQGRKRVEDYEQRPMLDSGQSCSVWCPCENIKINKSRTKTREQLPNKPAYIEDYLQSNRRNRPVSTQAKTSCVAPYLENRYRNFRQIRC